MTQSPATLASPAQAPLRRWLALATLALSAGLSAAPAAASPGGRGMPGDGGPGMVRLLEKAGASAEQRSQIEQIMKRARDDLGTQREQQQALRDKMREQFSQPTVDAAAVEGLRQQLLALHDARSKRMTQAMLDASKLLSAEQRQQLATLMKQRGERGHHRAHGEHGGPGRPQRHGG